MLLLLLLNSLGLHVCSLVRSPSLVRWIDAQLEPRRKGKKKNEYKCRYTVDLEPAEKMLIQTRQLVCIAAYVTDWSSASGSVQG